MLDVPVIDSVGDMLQMAIMSYNMPPKALAIQAECSASHIYSALHDLRSLPKKARQGLSKMNLIVALAVAMEATGFPRIFGYQKVDRHIQSMIIRLKKQDKEVMLLIDDLPMMLLDKNCRNDLSAEDLPVLEAVMDHLISRTNSTFNLIMELEARYGLNVNNCLQKEKPQVRCAK